MSRATQRPPSSRRARTARSSKARPRRNSRCRRSADRSWSPRLIPPLRRRLPGLAGLCPAIARAATVWTMSGWMFDWHVWSPVAPSRLTAEAFLICASAEAGCGSIARLAIEPSSAPRPKHRRPSGFLVFLMWLEVRAIGALAVDLMCMSKSLREAMRPTKASAFMSLKIHSTIINSAQSKCLSRHCMSSLRFYRALSILRS